MKITPELIQRLHNTILDVISKGVTKFYNGGAIGFDMLAAETVIKLKADYPDIQLHLILPCPADEQIKGWNKEQILRHEKILQAADSVIVVSEHYNSNCMKLRNEKLVELSDVCICYCVNTKSGSGQTIRIAKSKGINILSII